MAFSRLLKVNVWVGLDRIETSLVSSFDYDGETYTLDVPHPVGFFATGEPFIISTSAGAFTRLGTPASDIQGDGYVGNGAMKNPFIAFGQSQGWDQYLAEYLPGSSYTTPYAAALNVDPFALGRGNLGWAAGEKASFVKSYRHASKTSTTDQYQTIGKYHVITVLDQAPPVGAYRPGMAGTAKSIYTRSMVDFMPRRYVLPGSFPDIATILASVPDNIAPFQQNSEQRRFLRTDNDLGTTNDGYSGEFTPHYARWIYALNSQNASAADRQEIIDKVITFAADIEAVLDAGGTLGGGAGQGGGIWLFGMAAAALMKDNALMAKFVAAEMQPVKTPIWTTSTNIGAAAPSKNGNTGQTYFAEHLNTPWVTPEMQSSGHDARYVAIGAMICAWEVTAILGFNQGPAGFANGAEMILNGGANSPANGSAAKLAFASRYRTWETPFFSGAYALQTSWKDAWDQVVGFGDFTPWTGVPDQPPQADATALDDDYFTAGDGSITLNTQGIDYATETVARVDMAYSLDRVQWIEESGITLSGNTYAKTGLLKGKAHYSRWRRASLSGNGPWSANHPRLDPINGGAERGLVTTEGTEANAAPVNTVVPVIHRLLHPSWSYKVWEPAPATLGLNDIELAAGVGYWSGFPAPTFKFQWKRGGAAIPSATSQAYVRTAADAGTVLTCDITAMNNQGMVTVMAEEVTCPALTTLPAGTLIDTDFKGAFAVDYEAEFASVSSFNYTVSHQPGGVDGGNPGALTYDKTGGWPGASFTLFRAAEAATTYDISGQWIVIGDSASGRADFRLRVMDGDDTLLQEFTIPGDDAISETVLQNFAGQFTTLGNTQIRIEISWPNGAGGAGGGTPHLTQLTIGAA